MKNYKTIIYLLTALIAVFFSHYCFAGPTYIYGLTSSLPIPADPDAAGQGWMTDAIIHVPDTHIISDLDVRISITHTSALDLQIYLVSPAGKSVCLNSYNFDEFYVGQNYFDTIFDDEAKTPIEQAKPPFTGRFKPKSGSLLSVFDGKDAKGFWKLRIYDACYYDTGTLNNVELMISNPEPATIALLAAGGFLLRRIKRRHSN